MGSSQPDLGPARSPRVLLTRPIEASRRLADDLESAGIAVEIWPLTRIVPLGMGFRLPPDVQGVLATSANGIRAFAAVTGRRDLPVLCVGAATADVARGLGFALAFSADGDAAALAALARTSGLRHLFHPHGRDTAADMAVLIGPGGPRVSAAAVYEAAETGPPPAPVAHALDAGRITLVTVWSPRNARILARHLAAAGGPAARCPLLAISEAVAAPLREAGLDDVEVAARPDGGAMRLAILDACKKP